MVAVGRTRERRYYCQNWRADVSAILTDEGSMVEWVKYSAYGVPFGLPAGDTDSDGDWDGDDKGRIGSGAYDVRKDVNLDGVEDSDDVDQGNAVTGGNHTLGRGVLSAGGPGGAVGNRRGYAGYEYAPELEGTGAAGRHLYHVRHRVYDADVGRWTRRDPLGYVDGMGLYEYVGGMAVVLTDVWGLRSLPCGSSPCSTQPGSERTQPLTPVPLPPACPPPGQGLPTPPPMPAPPITPPIIPPVSPPKSPSQCFHDCSNTWPGNLPKYRAHDAFTCPAWANCIANCSTSPGDPCRSAFRDSLNLACQRQGGLWPWNESGNLSEAESFAEGMKALGHCRQAQPAPPAVSPSSCATATAQCAAWIAGFGLTCTNPYSCLGVLLMIVGQGGELPASCQNMFACMYYYIPWYARPPITWYGERRAYAGARQ